MVRTDNPVPQLTEEDAFNYLVRFLRNPRPSGQTASNYGYDVYLPNVMFEFLRETARLEDPRRAEPMMVELSSTFYAAAWTLCRRGILRPGVRQMGKQVTDVGSGGSGFSITPFGDTWLKEASQDDACCVMCGAAAETILIALAETLRPRDEVLQIYRASGGRGKLQNLVIGGAPQHVKSEFEAFTGLLDHWRDDAAHGLQSNIDDQQAFTSLALLLRFAQWADDRLTRSGA